MKRALEFLIVCSLLLATACQSVKAQGEAPILNVVYKVSPDQSYKLYGYINHAVDLQVNGTFEASAAIRRITIFFTFTFDEMKNLPTGSNYTIGSYELVPGLLESRIVVSLPPANNGFEFDVIGTIYGDFSFIYRNSAHLPYVSVSTDTPPFAPSTLYVQIPENANTQVFSVTPSNLPTASIRTQGGSFLLINPSSVPGSTITLQYQPPVRDYLVFLYLVGIGAALIVLPYLFRQSMSTLKLGKLRRTLSRIGSALSSLDSRRLFATFILISVLMISLAFVFGPSPTAKVYLAATPDSSKLLGPYVAKAGYSYLTVRQAGDAFDRMADLGSYSAAIVADYPPPLLSGLGSVLHIIAIKGYAPAQYILELRAIYPNTLAVIGSPADLPSALSAIQPRANPLGLSPGHSVYTITVALEGLFSLFLPFVGMAFLSRTLIESRSGIIVSMGEAMGFSFFCFMFGQLVFMASSLYLGLPVALHAAISNSETAVGLFGFGGGTRPRELTASVGILFGLVSGKAGKFRIDRLALLGLVSVALFLLIDPLNVGSSFYDSVLAQSTSVEVGSGVSSGFAVRSLIGSAMDLFGSGYNVSLAYFAQHGASLFYLGAVPLALYSRVRRATATLLAISVSFISGFGFVRIADMFPTKAIASVIPGVVLGVGLAVVFLFLNSVEGTFRKRILESSA